MQFRNRNGMRTGSIRSTSSGFNMYGAGGSFGGSFQTSSYGGGTFKNRYGQRASSLTRY